MILELKKRIYYNKREISLKNCVSAFWHTVFLLYNDYIQPNYFQNDYIQN